MPGPSRLVWTAGVLLALCPQASFAQQKPHHTVAAKAPATAPAAPAAPAVKQLEEALRSTETKELSSSLCRAERHREP